jgi:hypothetical protein
MGGNGFKNYGNRDMGGYGAMRYDAYPVMSNAMRQQQDVRFFWVKILVE